MAFDFAVAFLVAFCCHIGLLNEINTANIVPRAFLLHPAVAVQDSILKFSVFCSVSALIIIFIIWFCFIKDNSSYG